MFIYSKKFFKNQQENSLKSAREIVPLVENLFIKKIESVVDIGCGTGAWLSVFLERGVLDCLGVDGSYVDTEMLKIPRDKFIEDNLNNPTSLKRKFDIAISLEVGEHLETNSSEKFVEFLTNLAPVVLFSAAIPGQGGDYHINEQWPDFWAKLFAKRGYQSVDCYRSKLWNNENVQYWYAQNMILYVHNSVRDSISLSDENYIKTQYPLSLVHPKMYQSINYRINSSLHTVLGSMKYFLKGFSKNKQAFTSDSSTRLSNETFYKDNESYSNLLDSRDAKNFKKYTDYVRKFLPTGGKFLDVGCGTGIAVDLLKESGDIYGIEVGDTSINKCKEKGLNCLLYDGKNIPYKDNFFDVVGSYNVLEHVDDPYVFLEGKLRVLKPKGFFIVVCPNFLSITNNYHHHTRGFLQKGKNFFGIFKRIILPGYKFEKMDIIVSENFQPDDDACNITNPLDIKKWAKEQGLTLEYSSSLSVYTSGLSVQLDRALLRPFLGSSFLVFQKHENKK